jgi:hypothetical protein
MGRLSEPAAALPLGICSNSLQIPDVSDQNHDAGCGIAVAQPHTGSSKKRTLTMWNWISCYVTGHDYSVCCNAGAMFLKCVTCGRRSQGWLVHQHEHAHRNA